MADYNYTESGLDNVILKGMEPVVDDTGEEVYSITNIALLHRAIAEDIINHPYALSGNEIRFLRTEMGLTQAKFAKKLYREGLTVSRWERDEITPDPVTDLTIRIIVRDSLKLEFDDEISKLLDNISDSKTTPILIDASQPGKFERIAA